MDFNFFCILSFLLDFMSFLFEVWWVLNFLKWDHLVSENFEMIPHAKALAKA